VVVGSPVICGLTDWFKGTGEGLTVYEVVPLVIYSPTAATVNLMGLNTPPGTFIHFSNMTVTATSTGIGDNLTIAGAVLTTASETDKYTLIVDAASPTAKADLDIPLILSGATILSAPAGQLLPSAITVPSNASSPRPSVVVYDPANSTSNPAVLQVSLRVLGLSANGSTESLPSWLDFGFAPANMTLTPYQPAVLSIHESNTLIIPALHLQEGPGQTYSVAVAESINGVTSTQFVAVTFTPPVTL